MAEDQIQKERAQGRASAPGSSARIGERITPRRRSGPRRKVCRFCADKTLPLDYKEFKVLETFITEGGKIVPSRVSGNCAKHQRRLALEVKRARILALLPFTTLSA